VNEPRISVVIPVHNGARFLAQALRSIQTKNGWTVEIIVVDDGSSDGSADVARRFPGVRVLTQENAGAAAARNAGIRASSGDWITFLDSDDLWPPGRLGDQMDFHLRHPEVGYSVGRYRWLLEPGTERPSWLRPADLATPPLGLLPGTLCVHRRVLDTVGLFDTRFRIGEGADWFVRARDAGISMQVLDAVLLIRRLHDRNLSHRTSELDANLFRILKDSLDRKRRRAEASSGEQ
jgi:glycosyltransferase involved in cell wall biosynthesis